ncbi:hypothetical protein GGQ98_002641 [Sphingosinicella soli]|uniref:Uncharacterized protein n=1 Tax=Sphingosinicella soli TaxID=333708 RepID=A0A7W7B2W4_9SPHN|nr:hypothetical protein [Sphingosinicella soli]
MSAKSCPNTAAFTDTLGAAAPAVLSSPSLPATDTPARFSALEWSVVALAERDPLSTLHSPGRVAVALGTLFGSRPNPQLADSKLEALRKVAVLTWHQGYSIAESAVRSFVAAGFSHDHYALLAGSITNARARRDRRNSR